jgi:integrase
MACKIDSPAKRSREPVSKKPIWHKVAPGIFLEYRKSPEARKWLVRYGTPYRMQVFADADDANVVASGAVTMSFKHASVQAVKLAEAANVPGAKAAMPVTVRRVVEEYIAVRNTRDAKIKGRDVRSDADTRLSRNVLSDVELSDTLLRDVTADVLREWADGVTLKPSNRKRLFGDLKAALRAGWEHHRKALPNDWRDEVSIGLKVEDDGENSREIQVLSEGQLSAVMRAAKELDIEGGWGGDLHRMLSALAVTGMRWSQVTRMVGADAKVQQRIGRDGAAVTDCVLMVPASRKGGRGAAKVGKKIKRIVAANDFDVIRPDASIPANATLLTRVQNVEVAPLVWRQGERVAWSSASAIARPWKDIVKRAGLPVSIIPYAFRHTSIVRQLRAGLPVAIVASLHDTSPAMIAKHYAAFIVDASDDMIAAVTVGIAA